MKGRHKVRVIYKSGVVQDIRCDQFKVTFSAMGGLARITWDNAHPSPLFVGVDHIAAVYEL